MTVFNPYGVHVLYPNELEVDDTITKLGEEKAQFVYDFAAEKILGEIMVVEGGENAYSLC